MKKVFGDDQSDLVIHTEVEAEAIKKFNAKRVNDKDKRRAEIRRIIEDKKIDRELGLDYLNT